jgi:hypothetical protein
MFSPLQRFPEEKSEAWTRLVAFLFSVFGFFDSLVEQHNR